MIFFKEILQLAAILENAGYFKSPKTMFLNSTKTNNKIPPFKVFLRKLISLRDTVTAHNKMFRRKKLHLDTLFSKYRRGKSPMSLAGSTPFLCSFGLDLSLFPFFQ